MVITVVHLEEVRALMAESAERLATVAKQVAALDSQRQQFEGEVRKLSGAFDICAASFAQSVPLSPAQLDSLPVSVQDALGYTKPEPEPAA